MSWAICQSLQTSAEDHHFPRHGSEPVDICFKQTNPRDIFGTCWNMGMIDRGRCRLPGRERKKENTKSKERVGQMAKRPSVGVASDWWTWAELFLSSLYSYTGQAMQPNRARGGGRASPISPNFPMGDRRLGGNQDLIGFKLRLASIQISRIGLAGPSPARLPPGLDTRGEYGETVADHWPAHWCHRSQGNCDF